MVKDISRLDVKSIMTKTPDKKEKDLIKIKQDEKERQQKERIDNIRL